MATKKTARSKKKSKLTQSALAKIAMPHAEILGLMSTGEPAGLKPPKLGHPKAIVIVCAAANTSPSNLPRSLSQLGINGGPFRTDVFNGVTMAGYVIAADQIPNAPTTTLIQVVTVIQNADAA